MIKKTIRYYYQYGILSLLKRVWYRLGFPYLNRALIFLKLDLNNIPNELNRSDSFYIVKMDEIRNEQDYYDGWFSKKEAIQRLKNGNRLFVSKINGRAATYLWAEKEKATVNWFDLHMHLPEDTVYITGAYSVPEIRRKGFAFKIFKDVVNYYKNEGYNKAICVINPSNSASLKMSKKLGFKEYQIIHFKRFLFIKYFAVKKFGSNQKKIFVSVFHTPKNIWNIFF